ncbi:MAG: BamA/TamA family outer membrane protein [Prevotellaceae bacterium]|nr:BamA/TamA family outer membrane protein [Prevotellaceae bacterium]
MLGVFFASCSATKYVPEGEHILWRENLRVEGQGMKKEEVDLLNRPQPNRTILGVFRLNLWFYNRSSDKNTRISRWLRKVGEPPVIFDSMAMLATAENLQQYVEQRGFYGSQVSDTVVYRKRKAHVSYRVQLAQPYRISSISYDVADKSLDTALIINPRRRRIREGDVFDGDALKAESERIAAEMRRHGYFYFVDRYVTYSADTAAGNRGVHLTVLVHSEPTADGSVRSHRRFYVKSMVINPEYSSEKAIGNASYSTGWDTTHLRNFDLLCKDCNQPEAKPFLRPSLLNVNNRITLGGLYNEEDVNRTYANLGNLLLFKSVNIRFTEPPADPLLPDTAPRPLQGSMVLSPFKRQSYTWGGEVSLGGSGLNLFGMAATLSYQHKNLFRGAEILGVSLTGAFQKVQVYADSAPQNSYELGASVSLNVPKFMVPFNFAWYGDVFSPRTQIALSGDFQQRPDYTRVLGVLTFGYSWRSLGAMTFIYNLVDMNIISMQKISGTFLQSIANNPYMVNSYRDAFLLGSTFSAIYNSRATRRSRQQHIRADVEFKGNTLWLGYKLAGASTMYNAETGTRSYGVWGTSFSQFVKFDLNYTTLRQLNASNSIALRALGGVGMAYANSYSLPYDKLYYAGGANSLRGWQIRNVGPGNYSGTGDTISILNRLADMRLEFNIEYRFKLFWKFEGALFYDVGNIWAIHKQDSRSGALFSFKQLPKQVAMDFGAGLRLNFTVLVIRLDYGTKLHDPAATGAYFVNPRRWFSTENSSVFIALGYPF